MARLVFWDVDTQRDFMEPSGRMYVPDAEGIVRNLQRLTRFIRARGGTLVASVCDHTESDAEISPTPDYRRTFPPHCLRGTPGQEKIAATRLRDPVVIENRPYAHGELAALLPERGGEVLIEKQQFDVFTNPATTTLVALLRPDPAVVYGVAQDVCVDRAIVGLAGAGCRLFFVEDAARSIDAEVAARCAAEWRRLGVVFTTTKAIVEGGVLGRP